MKRFLEETKSSLHQLGKDGKVHIVLGNEACDLDSAVATLVYAFYLYKGNTHPGKVIIPVLNIRSNELKLRTEIVHFFKETSVPLDLLIFRDNIDIKTLHESGKLSITLVDHNQLTRNDKLFQTSVIEVIDHHQKEVNYDLSRCQTTIEMVGSCCTLIAEILLNGQPQFIDQQLALLLYGVILLDTVCLNDVAKRVTAKDKAMATELEKILGSSDRNGLFQKLYEAKFNISDMTLEDLLRRDVKVISNNTMSIAISSLTTLLEVVLTRPDAESELQKFSSKYNSQIVVLMGIQIDVVTQETARQLAIYSSSQGYREQLVDVLEGVSSYGPKLQLQLLLPPFPSVVVYQQGNIAASRKVILPLLNTFLLGDKSPSLSNGSGGSCSGCTLASNCEMKSGNRRNIAESRSEDDDLTNFDPLTSESEDVFDSLANAATHLHVLGIGDPISHAGSSQSSSNQNSCPYTPQNSCTDGGLELDPYARQILPSFNSREMMEKIESKRGKLRGYVGEGESDNTSYPFTPKNSFVDNTLDSYVRNIPSFDSGDFLLKVNEKVSTMTTSAGDEGNGNITVEVPVIEHPADTKTVRNGHLDISAVKDRIMQMDIEIGSSESQISSHAAVNRSDPDSQPQGRNDKDREIVQCCPEAVSLSDKLDKSDEKMDTSETSGSSEKTLPLDDLYVQTTTELNNLTTNTITSSATNAVDATTTTTASTNANMLLRKSTETHSETMAGNARTNSTASTSSLQGEDTDLELPSNYQTETVDFPDSPRQLKLMNQSANGLQQGASVDESLQEEDDKTEQPDDEVFRAVLSPSSEGVKLKKARRLHITPEVLRAPTFPESSSEDTLSSSNETESDDYYEDNGLAYAAENNFSFGSIDLRNLSEHFIMMNLGTVSTPMHSLTCERKSNFNPSPLDGQATCDNESGVEPFGKTEMSNDRISANTVHKIRSCFGQEKIKDIYVMGGKLQELLTPEEIKEILENSEAYADCFEEDIFEALQILKLTSTCSPKNKKTKIPVNKELLDCSITEHFESELYLSAVFEGSKSLKRHKRRLVATPSHSFASVVDLTQTTSPLAPSMKKKITAPISLYSFDVSTSPEVDTGIPAEDSEGFYPIASSSSLKRAERQEVKKSLERPNTLNASGKKKRKIKVNPDILNSADELDDNNSLSSLSNRSEEDVLSPIDDMATPDDIDTPEELEDSTCSPSEPIPEVSAAEERDEERRWRTCVIGGVQRKIDMKVIEPYKKVLSHGGYYGPKRSAIIVFCACYLPDHSRKDYDYVMDNLFLYVLTTLDQLVAEDYILVYLHGAMDRNNMPTFGWLKRCYQMIDRRLRKNLKGLYLVHPTFWLKTIVLMTKPFISSKFSRKLQFVNTLQELSELVPIDQMSIPDRVKQMEFELMIKEKKKHLRPQKQDPRKSNKHKEMARNGDGGDAEEEAYRRSQVGHITFTGGWV